MGWILRRRTRQSDQPVALLFVGWVIFCIGCRPAIESDSSSVLLETLSNQEDQFSPEHPLEFLDPECPSDVQFLRDPSGSASIGGLIADHSVVVDLYPERGVWDVSQFNHVQLNVTNRGSALVWVEGRLDNPDAEDWRNSIPSQLHLMPGESGTLGIAMYRPEADFDGPPIFASMRTKPNGHRQHWRKFDVSNVEKLRLVIRSATPDFQIENLWLSASYPYVSGDTSDELSLPFLDALGQRKLGSWPGKVDSDQPLSSEPEPETNTANRRSRFGGWLDGPRLDATGRFRIQKHDGRWWFVDPEGYLFWSHGINGVSAPVYAGIDERRELFEWLPSREDPKFGDCYREKEGKLQFDFRRANLIRRFGSDWLDRSTQRTIARLNRWGFNTGGAWTNTTVLQAQQVAHTPVVHLWFPKHAKVGQTPDPFAPVFRTQVKKAIRRKSAGLREDPWCVGVFVGNEIQWPIDLVAQVLRAPADQPARIAFLDRLKSKYETIDALNDSWGTRFPSFVEVNLDSPSQSSSTRETDVSDFLDRYADEFYRICDEVLNEELPDHLFLGSRVHVSPTEVAIAAQRWVDVFSLNYYTPLAGVGSVPLDADKPILITEYHFGAVDRGVPGCGLMGVHDQRERSRAFAGYVISALLDPRIVGTHWFTYSDQSAAGNPAPNNQVGWVDILDQPYPEMVDVASALGPMLYDIRVGEKDLMVNLEEVLASDTTPSGTARAVRSP